MFDVSLPHLLVFLALGSLVFLLQPGLLFMLLLTWRRALVLPATLCTGLVASLATLPLGQHLRFAREHPHVFFCGNPIFLPLAWGGGCIYAFGLVGILGMASMRGGRMARLILGAGVPLSGRFGLAGLLWGFTH